MGVIASDGSRPFLLNNVDKEKKNNKNLVGFNKKMYRCKRSFEGSTSRLT